MRFDSLSTAAEDWRLQLPHTEQEDDSGISEDKRMLLTYQLFASFCLYRSIKCISPILVCLQASECAKIPKVYPIVFELS